MTGIVLEFAFTPIKIFTNNNCGTLKPTLKEVSKIETKICAVATIDCTHKQEMNHFQLY